MAWMDLLDATNSLLAVILGTVGTGAAIIAWSYKRVARIARDAVADSPRRAAEREELRDALAGLRRDVHEQDERLHAIERRMEAGATARDLSELSARVAETQAEMRIVRGMIDTIYRAALQEAAK